MEDGRINDNQISASSSYSNKVSPWYGRINVMRGNGGWKSKVKAAGEYLQIDLGSRKRIHKVATQGRPRRNADGSDFYVSKYSLNYSDDGVQWTNYRVSGETMVGIYIHLCIHPSLLPYLHPSINLSISPTIHPCVLGFHLRNRKISKALSEI